MTEQEQIEALKSQLLRREIERMNPVDADVVAMLVGNFGIAPDGRLIVQNENGAAVVGDGPGYTMSVSEKIDALAKNRPALFKEKSGSETEKNPFAKGVHFNLTEQMVMMRTAPERAEYLQYLASTGKN